MGHKLPTAPIRAKWLFDGGRILRLIPPAKTYKEWFQKIIQYMNKEVDGSHAYCIEMINDVYLEKSVKNHLRSQRGEAGVNVYLSSVYQEMPSASEWGQFLFNNENKTSLIWLIVDYFCCEEGRSNLLYPLVITKDKFTYKITKQRVENLFECNHEEADSRLVFHASIEDLPLVFVADDTDIVVLLLYAYYKINPNNIGSITESVRNDVVKYLPHFHSISGCDTVSYIFNRGKHTIFKENILGNSHVLSNLGELGKEKILTDAHIKKAKSFIQCVIYFGDSSESYVQTRIRIYEKLKLKTSMKIPPNPYSVQNHILRAHYQLYSWLRCLDMTIEPIDIESYGWTFSNGHPQPSWFEKAVQMPPSRERSKLKKQ